MDTTTLTERTFAGTEAQGFTLSSYDGTIAVELSNRPVPYHITRCFPQELKRGQRQRLAMSSCRIACMCVDVVRGRIPPHNIELMVSPSCMKRLETMAYLLKNHMRTHPDLKAQLCYLPAVPTLVNAVLVSPTTTEAVASVVIGQVRYWISLVYRLESGKWICTSADVG